MHKRNVHALGLAAATAVIALATGVPHAAHAAPTLTVYGIVDMGVYYHHVSRAASALGGAVNQSQTGTISGVLSGSRWGIKGTEYLSGRWRATAVLEAGVNAQDGTLAQGGLGFGRQSTLSLSNPKYGSLTFGRRGALSYTYLVPIDPFAISGSQAGLGASFGSANGVRPNNLVLYQSPTLGGWQAAIGYSFNTGFTALYTDGSSSTRQPSTQFFGTNANMRMLTAGLSYNQGPASIFVAYDAVYAASHWRLDSDQREANPNQAVPKAWVAGGYYDFKVIKVSAAIGQTFDGLFFGQGAGAGGYTSPLNTASDGANILFAKGARTLQYALGATIPVGERASVLLSWQGMQPKGSLQNNDPFSDQLATQNIYSAAYVYRLSKQTNAYLWGSYGSNYQTFSTAKSSVIGTGIQHFF